MIIVIAKLKVKPGKKAELFELAKNVIAATRAEKACISYELLDNPYDESSSVFVERWTSKEMLAQHLKAPHLIEWRTKSAALLDGETALSLFEADETSF